MMIVRKMIIIPTFYVTLALFCYLGDAVGQNGTSNVAWAPDYSFLELFVIIVEA